ncbi:MAG TPA: succinate dehydrogenase cytochrome b subunit [Candidatus Paceibacterota bacterium]|nr:succinate dehydrogenase cytochrome b subunit [Verrucomicrobiota bacterium]HRY50207.1 succinate dehydrogenase cytochrome b subunit [Candidatus Paceibacterota bacterium]HSA00811.1 succinate dehydrogenase cytochrome b subunit [Candidatus Paceibacterota bacterium]
MKKWFRLLGSSIGKKYLLAITGCMLFGFVVVHLLGNLQIFLGPEALNTYAHFLQSKPLMVWAFRLFLLVVAGLHVFLAIQVWAENKRARPVGYACPDPVEASYASRTMIVTGLVVACFIVYHLLHFTVKAFHPEYAGMKDPVTGYLDVYRMMIQGFSNVWISCFYILGTSLLSFHLSHGISSMFQSFGLRNQMFRWFLDRLAIVVAVFYGLGSLSIPVAVLSGLIK